MTNAQGPILGIGNWELAIGHWSLVIGHSYNVGMSRVVYSQTASTADQETLRTVHQVRIVASTEEGNGVSTLPGGVYGFTYSPGLANSPLFAVRRYRSYEIHKLANGDVVLIAFADADDAARLTSAREDITVLVSPEPEEGRETLVMIRYARIRHHRQYAAPNQHGFSVTVKAD